MVLVIIGILIALQIDNWNTEAKQQKSLINHPNSISSNIAYDLAVVRTVLAKREKISTKNRTSFNTAETGFANDALTQAQELFYITATTSSYEALKGSDTLGRLQGSDIENLLYDYYDTVGRIAHNELSHKEYARQLVLQIVNQSFCQTAYWA